MRDTEDRLKEILTHDTGSEAKDQSDRVQNAVDRARRSLAVHDLVTLFVGWVWVLLAGLGAKLFTAHHAGREKSAQADTDADEHIEPNDSTRK